MQGTLTIEITRTKPNSWYSNKLGWKYEVYRCNFADVIPCYVIAETVDRLWPLFISDKDCVVCNQ